MYKISALALSTALIFSSISIPAFADQTVRIPQNQNTFTLQLNANATTGFQWFLENYNPTYFTYLGYHYIAPDQPKSGPKIMGAPGMAQFTFQVNPAFHQGPLTSTIHLVYGQPWDMTANTGTTITLVSQPLDSSDLSSRTPINAPLTAATAPAPTQNSIHNALLSDSSDDDSTPNMATVTSPVVQKPSENLTDDSSSINSPPLSAAPPATQTTQTTQTMTTTSNTAPTSIKNNPAQNWLSLPSANTNKTGS